MRQLRKIHIIGSVGSGKTTLSRNLSNVLGLPHHELDNVVWRRGPDGDIRNTPQQRDTQFMKIIQSEKWIVEGVHHEWVSDSFDRADFIIYIDMPVKKRNALILSRFIKQCLGVEMANYKPTIQMLRKMYKWNYQYEREDKREIFKKLDTFQEKVLVLRENDSDLALKRMHGDL